MSATTTALSDFLLARIAEDERDAREAGDFGRRWVSAPNNYDAGSVEAVDAPPGETGIVVYDEGRPHENQARHIARHDPARVLAECEAKRRIVTQVTEAADYDESIGEAWSQTAIAGWAALGHLAAVYADHSDYQLEWRP